MATDDLIPYPPHSTRGLAARWVSWLASSGPLRNPLTDTTGRYAHRHQPGDVHFLAGSPRGAVSRRLAVPAGRGLFMPVIALWEPAHLGLPVMGGASGSALLDGRPLEILSIGTPTAFTVKGALGNPVTLRRDPAQLRCWGLFAQAAPLEPGEHELVVEGTDGAALRLGATYRITVKG